MSCDFTRAPISRCLFEGVDEMELKVVPSSPDRCSLLIGLEWFACKYLVHRPEMRCEKSAVLSQPCDVEVVVKFTNTLRDLYVLCLSRCNWYHC